MSVNTELHLSLNLAWIRERWTTLTETVTKGTPLPWREPNLTSEQRAQLDQHARTEKIERGAFTLGESPAPIHLDALDKTIHLTTTLKELTIRVARDLYHDAVLVKAHRTHYKDPIVLIDYLTLYAPHLTEDTTEHLRQTTAQLRAQLTHHFSEIIDGQRLKADCPWCGTERLFIRLIGPEHNQEPVITCESDKCEPPASDCGTIWRGKPIWPLHEWEWLAGRILHAAA